MANRNVVKQSRPAAQVEKMSLTSGDVGSVNALVSRHVPWTERSGVWVECEAGVGIRLIDRQGNVTIDLVEEDGSTKLTVPAQTLTADVKQARACAIPVSRIEHLTSDQLAALGYL